MNEVAIIARVLKLCVVYDPKVQQMVRGYELEVLGREMPKEELPERDTSKKAEERS